MNPSLVDGDEPFSVAELPVGAVNDLLKEHDVFILSLVQLMQPICFNF